MTLTYGSFCSGIEGLGMGVEWATGAKPAWFFEIEKAPSKVLTKRFPNVKNHGDMTTCDYSTFSYVDLLIGGIPCQPFSTAGKRLGVADERHLWPYFSDAVSHIRPKYVFIEEVPDFVDEALPGVIADFARLGYDAEWGLFRASDVGAPHQRARLFVLAGDTSRLSGRSRKGFELPAHEPRQAVRTLGSDSALGRRDFAQYEPVVRRWEGILKRQAPEPQIESQRAKELSAEFVEWVMGMPSGWASSVLSNRQALRALGNGVVPQCVEKAFRTLHARLLEP